ncbi:hypothetical protein Scep_003455 [Stephania cephalantha]|uniref:Uncharacterized protein n=1 Tax=Stephania cephalantha TaxID=152367 RepID=A0AAP0PY28_9MAGN
MSMSVEDGSLLVTLGGHCYLGSISYMEAIENGFQLSYKVLAFQYFSFPFRSIIFATVDIHRAVPKSSSFRRSSFLLGIRQNGDRPPGVTSGQYLLGFLMTIGAAALLGLIIPCTEVVFTKVAKNITYSIVLQFQFCLSVSSTLFSTVGMNISKDFMAMPREAREFELGESKYYLVLVFTAVVFQLSVIGAMGLIFSASGLASGVIAYHEKFSGEKGISLAMCFWGFASYFYGSYRDTKKQTKENQIF